MVRSYGLPGWVADSPPKTPSATRTEPSNNTQSAWFNPSQRRKGQWLQVWWRQRSTAGRPGQRRPIRGCCRRTSSPWRGSPTPGQARSGDPRVCVRHSKPSGPLLLWTPLSCPCTLPSWAAPRLSGLGRCWPCCCWRWRPSWLSPQMCQGLSNLEDSGLTPPNTHTHTHAHTRCRSVSVKSQSRGNPSLVLVRSGL